VICTLRFAEVVILNIANDLLHRSIYGVPIVSARQWLDRGNAAQSPIDAFSDFWRGFNNLYAQTELTKVKAFLAARVLSEEAERILADHPRHVAYLLSQPIIDMRGNGRDTSAAIRAFQASDDAQVKLGELFAIIYQARCNLMHGQKSPTDDRDLKLCECCAPIVAAVVTCLVNRGCLTPSSRA
jgi:hypothetical protein